MLDEDEIHSLLTRLQDLDFNFHIPFHRMTHTLSLIGYESLPNYANSIMPLAIRQLSFYPVLATTVIHLYYNCNQPLRLFGASILQNKFILSTNIFASGYYTSKCLGQMVRGALMKKKVSGGILGFLLNRSMIWPYSILI